MEVAADENGGDYIMDADDLQCQPCSPKKQDGVEDTLALAEKDLCIFCKDEPNKRNQAYGAKCEPMVRGAFRDAVAQGQNASKSLSLLKKRGGEEYVKAIYVYHSKCTGVGRGSRRPAFGWV